MNRAALKVSPAKWVLLTVSLLFGLAVSEAVCRCLERPSLPTPSPNGWAILPEQSWMEYHSVLGWFHQKNKTAYLEKKGRKVAVHTNSQGLRGTKEYAAEEPSGVTRIYALGDSFTFGFGVEDSETFPSVMETLNPNFEVFNLGVPAYGVDQITLLLREFGMAHKPDFIFICLYPEDFWRALRAFNDGGYGKPYYTIEPDGKLKPIMSRSRPAANSRSRSSLRSSV